MSKHNGKDEGYACDAQQRLLFVQLALAGHEVNGISMTAITRAWEQKSGKTNQKNNVFRDLHNLKIAGLAEQIEETDTWRLTPKLVQIAMTHMRNLERHTSRLAEVQQRYGREI